MKRQLVILACAGALALFSRGNADEGMFPISEIARLDLKARGAALEASDIYNPSGVSLIDAIVQLDGGTGSFVSADGLIITNHHIAFGGVQKASSPENDYVTHGFLASSLDREIPATGYTVRITESYRDISTEVLSVASPRMDFAGRTKKIEKRIKEIILMAEKQNPGKRAEVAEMFPGKTYILFLYTYLRDVRLVYVPPRTIGDFGGEIDNWVWPRHTGDFSFLRAYVDPEGKPADYSAKNVPYRPRRFLKIAGAGVNEGDFIFLLGYPGRTYRHMTSHYLAYEQNLRMPYVADLYNWQIDQMEKMSETDPALAIKLAARIKGLANTMKNYRGKLTGMKRLDLVERKKEEEKKLLDFIAADPQRAAKYGSLLTDSEKIYANMTSWFEHDMILDYMPRMVTLLNLALAVIDAANERGKKEADRESDYMSRNFPRTLQRLKLSLKDFYQPVDRLFLSNMLARAAGLPKARRLPAIDRITAGKEAKVAVSAFIDGLYTRTQLHDGIYFETWMQKSWRDVKKNTDPLITFARELYPSILQLREMRRQQKGKLDRLYADLIDAKRLFLQRDFIPDANSTLRLTCGHIKGYTGFDGILKKPITTLQGVVEKTTGKWPFETPKKVLELFAAKDFGRFGLPQGADLPVDILYDADTTGGNSGSPVLNSRGELVGVNFDRTGEATINDYTWSRDFSRSIAVDIRYVLWVTQKFAGATRLLEEMGITL